MHNSYRGWTTVDVKRLKELYHAHSMHDLSVIFGRTHDAVKKKALELGLRRPAHRFKRGSIYPPQDPNNKVVKGFREAYFLLLDGHHEEALHEIEKALGLDHSTINSSS